MQRKLSSEQAQKCKHCEWRDRTNDSVVICPWAAKCIKGEGKDVPRLVKNPCEEESQVTE